MTDDAVKTRMEQLMVPVDRQIMECMNSHDQLMLACAMMQRTREIFDVVLGEEGRRQMFREVA